MLDTAGTKIAGAVWSTPVRKVLGVFVVVFVLILAVRIGVETYYNGRIMPGVVAAGVNIGGMPLDQARDALQKETKNYKIAVKVGDHSYEATPETLGVTFDTSLTLSQAYQAGRSALSVVSVTQSVPMVYSVDKDKLTNFAVSVATQSGVPASNATVAINEGQVNVVADKPGFAVDQNSLKSMIERSLKYPAATPDLTVASQQLSAEVKKGDLDPTVEAVNAILGLSVSLSYDSKTYTPDRAQIGSWLVLSRQDGGAAKIAVNVDSGKVKDYVQGIAGSINRDSVSKKVTVQGGASTTTREGQDGLSVDQDAATAAIMGALNNKQNLSYALLVKTVAFTTDTTYVSDVAGCSVLDGKDSYVEVNLSTQHLCVWDNHNVVYQAPVTTGASGAGLGTPTGLYAIQGKSTDFWMDGRPLGYNYLVHVDYWMPFFGNYGMHDSCNAGYSSYDSVHCWRSSWGGQDYTYIGSHGCVNMSNEAAAFIYRWSHVGTPVWVHN